MLGVILAVVGLALGGLLKGATGAGAPVIAVPVVAMFFGVPTAVTVFAVPNVLANVWQAWTYRSEQLPKPFMLMFAGGGALGTFLGTLLLVKLPGDALTLIVAAAVFIYIGFRVARPGWVLAYPIAEKLSLAVGTVAGVLFGASALSAPATLSFLNAMRLDRRCFIGTVSAFFTAMGVVQVPMLFAYDVMNWHKFLISAAAFLPILAFMPVGSFLARHISRETFDRIILGVLFLIALKLVAGVIF